jgi:hypothetical protein
MMFDRPEDVVEEMVQGMLAFDHTLRRLSDLNVVIRNDYQSVKIKEVYGNRNRRQSLF